LAAAVVGGKLYAIGGIGGTIKENEEYDPAANTWVTKVAMPTARYALSAAAVDGKLYAIGGYSGSSLNKNEEYDPAANVWTTKAVMPTARVYLVAAVVGRKLYAIGGNGVTQKENEEYDPAANVWITRAVMPTARVYLAAAVVGGKLYAIGGIGGTIKENEEYDPAVDAWATKADMPTARERLSAAAVGGKIYAMGGGGAINEEYDPGVAQKFTGLIPNTEYDFKAKAMDMNGVETAECVEVSTYTMAYVAAPAVFSNVYPSSVTVAWSSGTALGGYNGSGTTYLVQTSRLDNFSEISGSSETANIFAMIEGLSPPGTFYFRIKAANSIGSWSDYIVIGSTANGSSAPLNPVISAIYKSSVTVSYGAVADVDGYVVEVSTVSDFSLILYSSSTGDNLLETLTVQDMVLNATYYMRAGSLIGMATDYANIDPPTATLPIETPTNIVFDEITCGTITASAYTATPGFSNLHSGESATNVSIDETYAGWHMGGNTWITKADIPTTHYQLSAAVVGGKIYAIGPNKNEEYDPAANTWVTKADMPTGRSLLSAAAVGGKIYVIGGDGGTRKENEEYDPVANNWTTKAVMPTARYGLASAIVGGKIYAIGGYTGSSSDKNEEYDPAINAWVTRVAMPTARYFLSAAAVGGKLYAIGGTGVTQKENEEYDPVVDEWTTKAVMPTARYDLAAAAVGGKIYVIGGCTGSSSDKNEEYDPAANTWTTKADMPTARERLSAAAVGGKLYAIGGNGLSDNKNEEYDPGVAQKFTGLAPNTEYDFKAKARNIDGTETEESVTVSTYTLAAVAQSTGPVFANVFTSSITVNWSSGTTTGGYNGSGANYNVEISTNSDFESRASSATTVNLTFPFNGLSQNTTYYARVKAANSLGVWGDYFVLGSTTTLDTTPPTSSITYPYDSGYIGQTGKIEGTAYDTPNGMVENAYVRIKQSTGPNVDHYWRVSDSSWTVENAPDVWNEIPTYGTLSPDATWWQLNTNPWQTGETYEMNAYVKDNADNYEAVYSTVTDIKADFTAPTSTVTYPTNGSIIDVGLTTSSGSASDTAPGVLDKVRVSYYCASDVCIGKYWNRNSGAWDSATEIFYDANIAGNTWEATGISTPTWITTPAGINYQIFAKAVDEAGNEVVKPGSPAAESSYTEFTLKTPLPISHIINPDETVPHWKIAAIPDIAGTAAYSTTVQLKIIDFGADFTEGAGNDDLYWNGSVWVSTNTFNNFVGVHSFVEPNWSWSIPSGSWNDNRKYKVYSIAIHEVNNTTETEKSGHIFIIDSTTPTSKATFPTGTVSSVNSISGTAQDTLPGELKASGVVEISIKQIDDGLCFDGSSFVVCPGGAYPDDRIWIATATVDNVQGQPGNWTFDTSGISWINEKNYQVQALAIDKAGNEATYPGAASPDISFYFQTPQADTTISSPEGPDDKNYKSSDVSVISGVGSNLRTIDSVEIHIKRLKEPASWWYEPSQHWVNSDTYTFVNHTAGSWSQSISGAVAFTVDNASYTITTIGYNSSNEAQSPSTQRRIVIDDTPPSAAITYPVSLPNVAGNLKSLTSVSGTVYEDFEIKSASVSFRETDYGMYYDVEFDTFNSVTQKWVTADIAGSGPNYTWSVSAPPLQDNISYNIQIIADDIAGNVMTPPTATNILYDTTPPSSGVVSPADGSFFNNIALITGTAQDQNTNPSGASGAQITISSGTAFWNGAIWVESETWLAAASGANWTKNTQLPPSDNISGLIDGGLYTIRTRAYDIAGNTETVSGESSFRFDVSSPTAYIQEPENNTRHNVLNLITGTAQDSFNVNYPQIRIYDIPLAKYWSESSGWIDISTWNIVNSSSAMSGEFTWIYDSSAIIWPDRDNELEVEIKVMDEAGNYSIVSSTFSFDKTPPTSAILYPSSDNILYSSMTNIMGTALDYTSSLDSVKIKMWYLDTGTTYYWSPTLQSGKHWVIGDMGWPSSLGGGPKATTLNWDFTNADFLNSDLITYAWKQATHDGLNGKKFYIVAKAIDATTNEQISYSTRTFILDNEPPMSMPVEPEADSAYKAITVLSGTSVDAVTTVQSAVISILSEDEAGGPKYFDGSAFTSDTEVWQSVSNLYPSSWTYTSGFLTFADAHHYVIKSSATDSVGNVQLAVGKSRFLFDTTEPQSSILNPVNDAIYNDNKILFGNSSDPGFTDGINGAGSGVYPSLGWHKGGVNILVFRDTEPYLASAGPIPYGGWDDTGYFWNGSTWTAASEGAVWDSAVFTDSLGNWQYDSLVCPDPNPTNIPCWVRGDRYASWIKATDNAGTQQTIITQCPKFYIAAPAQSFALSVSVNPAEAGSDITLTVEAKDGIA
ncbi:MAG: Ig-like domain repeat protein, partial [Elusimicrobia bacterium]|nr:Ig-like domain repeat protein [Elusimicrobiota bacterium]